MEKHDIILRGGHVIDPASNLSAKADIAIHEGKISDVGDLAGATAVRDIDVSGLYVTPGLIDMHTHIYPKPPFTKDVLPGIFADAHMPRQGVTTVMDAGTCGTEDFPDFYRQLIAGAKVRTYALLNVFPGGMLHLADEGQQALFDPERVAEMAKAYPGVILGIKTAHYRPFPPFDAAHPAWASVDAALFAAGLAGLPAMFDVIPAVPERTYPALLQKMRPGDIHAHVYAPHIPILDEAGNIAPFMREARSRGILFDLAHGAQSFGFVHAVPAVRQGFYPDFISSDLYMDNVCGPAVGLLHIMSKCLAMGMSLEDVAYRTTLRPAEMLHIPEVGRLAPGAPADVAVLRFIEEPVGFSDAAGTRLDGRGYLDCRLTLRNGEALYNPYGMGCPAFAG